MAAKKKGETPNAPRSLYPEKTPKAVADAIKKNQRQRKKAEGRTIVDVVADEIRNQPGRLGR